MNEPKDTSPPSASVYVDGLNLDTALKYRFVDRRWINPVELVYQASFPDVSRIRTLRYFSARLFGRKSSRSQHLYLKALRRLPELVIHMGVMQSKRIHRPLMNLPVAGATIMSDFPTVLPEGVHRVLGDRPRDIPVYKMLEALERGRRETKSPDRPVIVEVSTTEEKQSDVNLATHLLNDAWKGVFDVAVVVTNDSDIIEPIRVVREERNKTVHVLCPAKRMAGRLEKVASSVVCISQRMVDSAQFPDHIPGTDLARPEEW